MPDIKSILKSVHTLSDYYKVDSSRILHAFLIDYLQSSVFERPLDSFLEEQASVCLGENAYKDLFPDEVISGEVVEVAESSIPIAGLLQEETEPFRGPESINADLSAISLLVERHEVMDTDKKIKSLCQDARLRFSAFPHGKIKAVKDMQLLRHGGHH